MTRPKKPAPARGRRSTELSPDWDSERPAVRLIEQIYAAGGDIEIVGGDVQLFGRIDRELRQEVEKHKAAILDELTPKPDPPAPDRRVERSLLTQAEIKQLKRICNDRRFISEYENLTAAVLRLFYKQRSARTPAQIRTHLKTLKAWSESVGGAVSEILSDRRARALLEREMEKVNKAFPGSVSSPARYFQRMQSIANDLDTFSEIVSFVYGNVPDKNEMMAERHAAYGISKLFERFGIKYSTYENGNGHAAFCLKLIFEKAGKLTKRGQVGGWLRKRPKPLTSCWNCAKEIIRFDPVSQVNTLPDVCPHCGADQRPDPPKVKTGKHGKLGQRKKNADT